MHFRYIYVSDNSCFLTDATPKIYLEDGQMGFDSNDSLQFYSLAAALK